MSSANNTSLEHYEVWFLTGSQHLYGEDVLKQVAAQSQEIAAALNESSEVPVKLVWKPVLTDSDAIRRTALEANSDDSVIGVTAWMHTFSPAKMWIQGLDLLRKPLLHLHTQANVELPWADIDFDFMNLNQAAHGDREFGYIQSRLGVPRKTVVGHVSNPEVARQVGVWQRASAGWAAVRNLKLTRFGDNMRNVAVTEGDKTEAELRFGVSVNTWSVNELADAVHGAAESDVDALVAEYERLYEVVPELRSAEHAMSPSATAPASSSGCAASSKPTALPPSPPPSRTSASCGSCRAWPSSGSWPTATASAPKATGRPPS
jgi:L-arabinose isomerase